MCTEVWSVRKVESIRASKGVGNSLLFKCFEKLSMGRMIYIHHLCLNVLKIKLELRGNEKISYTTITT